MNLLHRAIKFVHSFAAASKILVNRMFHQDFFIFIDFFRSKAVITGSFLPAIEAAELFRNKQSVAPVTGFIKKEKK